MTSTESIIGFGQQMQTYISTNYAKAATASPPTLEESWNSLTAFLGYYLERGWGFN